METTFTGEEGTLVLTDALAFGPDADGHRIGADVPHLLVRRLECTRGSVEVAVDYRPGPSTASSYRCSHQWTGESRPAAVPSGWCSPHRCALECRQGTATGSVRLASGQSLHLGLHRSTLSQVPARVWSQPELSAALERTVAGWQSWSRLHQQYDGPWADLVHQSGRVLQGLSYQPSGAIVAAPTTSLPEGVGGERNWDYRYSWVRDSSFTMEALWVAACPDEAATSSPS